jgi:hypothetical protein
MKALLSISRHLFMDIYWSRRIIVDRFPDLQQPAVALLLAAGQVVLGKSEIAQLALVIDCSQVAGSDTLISNEGADSVLSIPITGWKSIAKAVRRPERSLRRMHKRNPLPYIFQTPGRGRNSPMKLDRPGPLAELRRFLSGLEG